MASLASRAYTTRRAIHTHATRLLAPITPRKRAFASTTMGLVAVTAAAYAAGTLYPPRFMIMLFPRPSLAPASTDSPEGARQMAHLEEELQTLPNLVAHRAREDSSDWYETRLYPEGGRKTPENHFVLGVLNGPGKLGINAIVRVQKDESESIAFFHVGRGICSHDGIVHGGVLATLLDVTLGRTAFNNLPEKVAVTANLTMNYKAPTVANQFIVVKTRVVEKKGRKIVVHGFVETLDGTQLVEANALFIQPRYANSLKNPLVKV